MILISRSVILGRNHQRYIVQSSIDYIDQFAQIDFTGRPPVIWASAWSSDYTGPRNQLNQIKQCHSSFSIIRIGYVIFRVWYRIIKFLFVRI